MEPRRIRLPDGNIGLFRQDHTDEQIRSIIEERFPDAFVASESGQLMPKPLDLPEPEQPVEQEVVAPEDRDGIPLLRELAPAVSASWERTLAIPSRFAMQSSSQRLQRAATLQNLYNQMDAGATFDYRSAAETAKDIANVTAEDILRYQDFSPKRRKEEQDRLTATIAKDRQKYEESFAESMRVAEETAAGLAPRVGNFSDIRSFTDFLDYSGYMIGSGAAEFLPVLAAGTIGGLTGGPFGATAAAVGMSTIQALPMQSQQRLDYILKVTENMTDDNERADAIIKYLSDTAQTSTIVALAQGGLDAFGPTKVLSGIFKKKLAGEAGEEAVKKSETVREAAMEVAGQTLRVAGEEAVTGALQQVVDMAGQYQLKERTGDVFTGDNFIEVVDAAIAEAVGSLGAQGVNVATASGAQALRNRAKKNIEKAVTAARDTVEKSDVEVEEELAKISDRFSDAVETERARATEQGETLSEEEILKRAGQVVSEERKVEKEVAEDVKIDEVKTTVAPEETSEDVVAETEQEKTKEPVVETKETPAVEIETEGLSVTELEQKAFNFNRAAKGWEKRAKRGGKNSKANATYNNLLDKSIAYNEAAKKLKAAETEEQAAPKVEEPAPKLDTTPKESAPKVKIADKDFNRQAVQFTKDLSNPDNFEDGVTYTNSTKQAILARARQLKQKQEQQQTLRAEQEQLAQQEGDIDDAAVDAMLAAIDAEQTVLTNSQIFDRAENEILDELQSQDIDPFEDAIQDASDQITEQETLAEETIENPGPAIAEGVQNEVIDTEPPAPEERQRFDPFARREPQSQEPSSKKVSAPIANPLYDTLEAASKEGGEPRDVRAADVADAIDRISKSTGFEAILAKRLKPLLQGVSVRFVDPSEIGDNAGAYTETPDGEKVITLARATGTNDGRNNQTFLHEAIHAATSRIIEIYKSDPDSPLLQTKQKKALVGLERLMGRVQEKINKKKEIGNLSNAEIFFDGAGAFSNLAEFVSYGMSHPAMQDILQSMPAANAKYGGLSNFVKLVRETLGFGPGVQNAFDELIIITDRLLDKKALNALPPADIVAYAKKESQTEVTAKRKLAASDTSITFLDAMSAVFKQRDLKSTADLLYSIRDAINIPSLKAVLYTLPTQTIIDLGSRIYKLKGLARIQTAVRTISGERTRRLKNLAIEAERYAKFVREFGPRLNRFLSDSMHLSTLWDIDGNKYSTYEQAVKADAKLKEFERLANDQQETEQQRKYGQREATKRKTQLRIFYKGFKTSRKNVDEYQGWEQLNKDTKGQAANIYKMVKLRYQSNFKEYYDALVTKIKRSRAIGEDAKTNILATIQAEMLEEIKSGVYFPLMRFGDFYVGYGRGAKRTFQMFESATARNQRVREIVRQHKKDNPLDTRSDKEIEADITEIGDSISLRDELSGKKDTESSDLLRNIYKVMDDNTVVDPTSQQKTLTNINLLKNEIYQLYIKTLPEQSMRKRFLKRKGTAGFSNDAFRAFLTSNHQSINQLSKIKHDDMLRGAIASAYDELAGRGGQNLLRARAYVDRLVTRAMDDVHGEPLDSPAIENFVRYGNQAAFFFYLTSAKSALVQFTQLPIVGLPILAARFGMTKAFSTATKYLNVYDKLASFKEGADGQIKMAFEQPDLKKTKHVLKGIPEDYRQWYLDAIDAADDLDMFNATYALETSQRARVPTQSYNNLPARSLRTMFNFMSGAFHHAERTTRQIMFMSSLDLEMEQQMQGYERELAKVMEANPGMTRAQAVEALYAPYKAKTKEIAELMEENKFLVDSGRYTEADAVSDLLGKDKGIASPRAAAKKAASNAVDLSYEALFDYGQFNKAEILKGRGTRALIRIPAQFLTFPINMTVYMARNFYNMIPFIKNNTQKREAAIKFFGAQGMAFLFAGATGLWQYSTVMGLLEGMREMFRPDDEEEDQWYDEDDDGNPLGKRNLDLWFREWFIPTYFGPDSSLANALGLDREQALMLQRGVKLGPLSAITDYNIGSSTSLDGLFFTSGRSSDDLKEMLSKGIAEKILGPSGNLLWNDIPDAFEFFANGDFKKGAEKLTPAAFRGVIKGARLAEEGEVTRQGIQRRPAEWYHTGKLIGTALGFSSTEVAEIREKNFLAKDLETAILEERTELLSQYDKAINDLNRRNSQEAKERLERVWRDIGRFNVRNGMYAIKNKTLRDSLKQRQKARLDAEAGEGLMLKSPNSEDAILPLILKSAVYPEYEE